MTEEHKFPTYKVWSGLEYLPETNEELAEVQKDTLHYALYEWSKAMTALMDEVIKTLPDFLRKIWGVKA